MTIVTKIVSALSLIVSTGYVHASNTILVESSSDLGSMMLFSAGFVGLLVARKHMKSQTVELKI